MMISFEVENVKMPDLDFAKVEIWLNELAASFGKTVGNLNYLFCDDEKILIVNRQFLHHDYFTDIITFDYSRKEKISGDLFISLETVRSNSELFKVSYESELLRVIAHGLLHLCGIDDKGEGQREIMEHQEEKALEMWKKLINTDKA